MKRPLAPSPFPLSFPPKTDPPRAERERVNKRYLLIGGGLFVSFLSLFTAIPNPARAQVETILNVVASILGVIVQMLVRFMGWLFVKLSGIFINWIAPYNNFVTAAPVNEGWIILRDIANMFFIVVLLAIAFGTMFGREEYHYTKRLPRLLIMAVMINFSRTIVGIVIDFAQVIMLTFVNAFQAAAGGNLANMLGINELFSIDINSADVSGMEALISYILALVLISIATGTIGIIVVTLLYRIVSLWMLTILSPLAFLASTFPRGEKYYKDWWEKLICWAFSGPVLAFFLWLALATASTASSGFSARGPGIVEGPQVQVQGLITTAAREDNIVRFIVGIVMLLFGLQVAQEFCAKGAGYFSGLGKQALGYAKTGAKRLAMGGLKASGRKIMDKGGRRAVTAALGSLGASRIPGAKHLALGGLAAMRKGSSEMYKKEQEAFKAGAAADPNLALSMLRTKRPQTPRNDAMRAAQIDQALTNPKLRKALEDQGGPKAVQDLFNEREEISNRSGNPDIIDSFNEVKKKNPHLIKDPDEKKKMARMLSGQAALDMSPEALKDAVVAGSLSKNTRQFIEDRGSQVQKDNLKVGTDAATPDQRPDLIADATARKAKLAELEAKPGAIASLTPEVATAVYADMTSTQRDQTRAKIDLSKISPEVFKGVFGAERAEEFTQDNKPEQLAQLAKNPAAATAFQSAVVKSLEQAREANREPTKEEKQKAGDARFLSGMAPGEAYDGNYNLMVESMQQSPKMEQAIMGKMTVEMVQKDLNLQVALAKAIDLDRLTSMAAPAASKDEKKIARIIVKEIIASAKSDNASPETVARGEKVASNRWLTS